MLIHFEKPTGIVAKDFNNQHALPKERKIFPLIFRFQGTEPHLPMPLYEEPVA